MSALECSCLQADLNLLKKLVAKHEMLLCTVCTSLELASSARLLQSSWARCSCLNTLASFSCLSATYPVPCPISLAQENCAKWRGHGNHIVVLQLGHVALLFHAILVTKAINNSQAIKASIRRVRLHFELPTWKNVGAVRLVRFLTTLPQTYSAAKKACATPFCAWKAIGNDASRKQVVSQAVTTANGMPRPRSRNECIRDAAPGAKRSPGPMHRSQDDMEPITSSKLQEDASSRKCLQPGLGTVQVASVLSYQDLISSHLIS